MASLRQRVGSAQRRKDAQWAENQPKLAFDASARVQRCGRGRSSTSAIRAEVILREAHRIGVGGGGGSASQAKKKLQEDEPLGKHRGHAR